MGMVYSMFLFPMPFALNSDQAIIIDPLNTPFKNQKLLVKSSSNFWTRSLDRNAYVGIVFLELFYHKLYKIIIFKIPRKNKKLGDSPCYAIFWNLKKSSPCFQFSHNRYMSTFQIL